MIPQLRVDQLKVRISSTHVTRAAATSLAQPCIIIVRRIRDAECQVCRSSSAVTATLDVEVARGSFAYSNAGTPGPSPPPNLIPQRLADTHVMQEFLKSKGEPVSGKKADLVERVSDWLQNHS